MKTALLLAGLCFGVRTEAPIENHAETLTGHTGASAVEVTFRAMGDMDYRVENLGPATNFSHRATMRVQLEVDILTLTFYVHFQDAQTFAPAFDGVLDHAGPSSFAYQAHESKMFCAVLTDPVLVALFAGPDVDARVKTLTRFEVVNGQSDVIGSQVVHGVGEVRYLP